MVQSLSRTRRGQANAHAASMRGLLRLGRRLRRSVVSALLGIGVLAAAAAPARVEAGDILWGANGHPFVAYPGVPFTQQLDLLTALGAKSYRVNVTSLDQVPALADLVALARNRGLQILPLLAPPVDLANETEQVIYAKSFNFAVTIAARFKGDIKVWELGNELENYALLKPCETQDDGKVYPCSMGIAGGMTMMEYVGARWKKVSAVLKGLSDGIVSVDPQLKKAIGTAGWGHMGVFDRLLVDGVAWDLTVWHAYREETDEVFARLASYGKPIWITEINHPYGSHKDGPVGQADGLRSMIKALRRQQAKFNIEAVFFYELLDEPYWSDFEGQMGLVTQNKTNSGWAVGERKPAFDVVRQTIKAVDGAAAHGCDAQKFKVAGVTSASKVGYAFCLVFHHEPDGQGLLDYAQELDRGRDVLDLVKGLAESDWFTELHAPASRDDAEYVGWVHELLLGAQPPAAVLEAQVGALKGGQIDRRGVVAEVIKSTDFKKRHMLLFAPIRQTAVKKT